jgi:hypothetical protein
MGNSVPEKVAAYTMFNMLSSPVHTIKLQIIRILMAVNLSR